ncbi:MAG: monovalent cation/H(+) antiporter subunit G [Chthoniobacterales bacterium]|nr:monovalent cation/H(+) antiporter subunit G [Chthoniobacterales bacterium]MCX7712171.1 monovalent cation/H(+) antiporter subunit G [Chthoniobacterales bacterium]
MNSSFEWIELVGRTIGLLGAFFVFVAALGVFRFPDVYMRTHAATKAGTLGLGLLLLSVAIQYPSVPTFLKAIVILIFLFLTAPVAAHAISRAAFLQKVKLWERTHTNELEGKYSADGKTLDS